MFSRQQNSGFASPYYSLPRRVLLKPSMVSLPVDDAFEVRAADVVIQLGHFDIPMKNLADRRQHGGKFAILVRNRNIFTAVNAAHVGADFFGTNPTRRQTSWALGLRDFGFTGLSRCSFKPV